jgi:hypothetical protein
VRGALELLAAETIDTPGGAASRCEARGRFTREPDPGALVLQPDGSGDGVAMSAGAGGDRRRRMCRHGRGSAWLVEQAEGSVLDV